MARSALKFCCTFWFDVELCCHLRNLHFRRIFEKCCENSDPFLYWVFVYRMLFCCTFVYFESFKSIPSSKTFEQMLLRHSWIHKGLLRPPSTNWRVCLSKQYTWHVNKPSCNRKALGLGHTPKTGNMCIDGQMGWVLERRDMTYFLSQFCRDGFSFHVLITWNYRIFLCFHKISFPLF